MLGTAQTFAFLEHGCYPFMRLRGPVFIAFLSGAVSFSSLLSLVLLLPCVSELGSSPHLGYLAPGPTVVGLDSSSLIL
jgi:hypothetical protein